MEKLEKDGIKPGSDKKDLSEGKKDKLINFWDVVPNLEFIHNLDRLIKHGLAEKIVEDENGEILKFTVKDKETGEILFFDDTEGFKKLAERMRKIMREKETF